MQASCPLSPEDRPEDVADKIHLLEHRHYADVIEELMMKLD
jgi:phosphoribosylglycinamide formyltransferase-1